MKDLKKKKKIFFKEKYGHYLNSKLMLETLQFHNILSDNFWFKSKFMHCFQCSRIQITIRMFTNNKTYGQWKLNKTLE